MPVSLWGAPRHKTTGLVHELINAKEPQKTTRLSTGRHKKTTTIPSTVCEKFLQSKCIRNQICY